MSKNRVLYESYPLVVNLYTNGRGPQYNLHIKRLRRDDDGKILRNDEWRTYEFFPPEVQKILESEGAQLENLLYEMHGSLLASLMYLDIKDPEIIRDAFEKASKAL